MDSTINGKKVHIKNPLDLIGLGRHTLEFNIPKADYWDLFKETMQVPSLKAGGVKNLLMGGWVYVDPYDQGRSLWTKEHFTKENGDIWNSFSVQGDIFDYGTYTSGYYGFSNSSSASGDADFAMYHQVNQLQPNTTYTWQWEIKRTTRYITGGLETFIGTSSNTIIDTTKPFIINGEEQKSPYQYADGFVNWGNIIDSEDTTWHKVWITFTTKSNLPPTGARSIRWRAKKGSSWKVKNFMLFTGGTVNGEEFRLSEQDHYEWMLYEGKKGFREVSANFGFYYSEDYKFCSAFKLNIHAGVETTGWNPVTQEFEVRAEVESFAQIVNPTIKHYSDIKDIPNDVNWNNTIIYNPEPNGNDYLQCKAKGGYMSLFRVAKDNYSPNVPKRWLATFFKDVPNSKWLYGGYCYTGVLQTYDIEN